MKYQVYLFNLLFNLNGHCCPCVKNDLWHTTSTRGASTKFKTLLNLSAQICLGGALLGVRSLWSHLLRVLTPGGGRLTFQMEGRDGI